MVLELSGVKDILTKSLGTSIKLTLPVLLFLLSVSSRTRQKKCQKETGGAAKPGRWSPVAKLCITLVKSGIGYERSNDSEGSGFSSYA